MPTLLLRDLQYRGWRILAVVGLVAVVMTLLFLMAGLVGQFNAEPELATQKAGGDNSWLVPAGASGPFTSAQLVDQASAASVDGVPILTARGTADVTPVVLIGRQTIPADLAALTDGRLATSDAEVVADVSLGAAVGDPLLVNGQPTTVVGLVEDATVLAGVPLVFSSLTFVQDSLLSGERVVSAVLVEQPPTAIPDGLQLMSSDEVVADALAPLENAIGSVNLVRALLWLITLIIIAAVIYITAMERTRDFAVLKAVGARNKDLALSLLVQAVVMTMLATALAAVLQIFVKPLFPMDVRIPRSAWWQIPLAAGLVSLVAGMVGVRRVNATSPAEAFG